MTVLKREIMPIASQTDIVGIRQATRVWAAELGFSLIDQTKIITAASELARNALEHGGGGAAEFEMVEEGKRRGLRLIFKDNGPGIPDVTKALSDGYTTGAGLGLGLGGSKRLCNDFHIESTVGKGTRVTIARWK